MKIQQLIAREVLDSRGNPTVAVRAVLSDGTSAEAMVPSGASTGTHEALELRDGDLKRYGGLGVLKACRNVKEEIFQAVQAIDAEDQQAIDRRMIELDGTENKSRLGANAMLGVSLATAHAVAQARGKELYASLQETYGLQPKARLPSLMMNVINGGRHADNGLDVQEFMILPRQEAFHERIRCGAEVFHGLKKILLERGNSTAVGDEGGFTPLLARNEEALQLLEEAVAKVGYTAGKDVKFAIDAAASEFFKAGEYHFDGVQKTAEELIEVYTSWVDRYPLISIEDGFAEDDWEHWKDLTKALGKRILLVGDDLFVTNSKRLQKGIDESIGNAILVKVNQIGTLSETIGTIQRAQQHQYTVVVSHRSGETEDTTIADLAVAVGAEYIKTGSLSRSERIAKYNRLLAIEEEGKQ